MKYIYLKLFFLEGDISSHDKSFKNNSKIKNNQ